MWCDGTNQKVIPTSFIYFPSWKHTHTDTNTAVFWATILNTDDNYIFFPFIYLFLEREEGREIERERNIDVWFPLVHPLLGPGPQPRHVPWLEIELATFWFSDQSSIHWATPARARWQLCFLTFMEELTKPATFPKTNITMNDILWRNTFNYWKTFVFY